MSVAATVDRTGLDRVLVATDLSGRSGKAVARGLNLASKYSAHIKIVHVVDDDQPEVLVELEASRSSELLTEFVRPLVQQYGVEPEIEVIKGMASEAIRMAADAMNADLLVLGEHRRLKGRDVFTGTTVERVIRMCGRPVLVARLESDQTYRSVVAAIDFSYPSVEALRFVSRASFLGCSELVLLHAYLPLAEGFMRYANVGEDRIEDYARSLADEARTALESLVKTVPAAGLSPELVVQEGAPQEVIGEFIATRLPQLVVLGTTGNSLLKNIFIGSVANAVLRDAACDVLAYAGRRDGE
jgi:nucleotide-binding universal stress UspA family protein